MNDADMMFSNWANDDEVTKYLTWQSHGSIDITKDILSKWVDNYKNLNFYQWCIEHDDIAIGSIGINKIDEELKSGEIGFCIGKKWWRKGITSEALKYVKNFLVEEVRFEHLWAWHHIYNPNSGMVLTKCGFNHVDEVDDYEKYMSTGSKVIIYEYKSSFV